MMDLFVLFDCILNVIRICVVSEELNSSSHIKVLFCSVHITDHRTVNYEGHPISSDNDPIKQNLFL